MRGQQVAPALLPPSFLERAGDLGQPFAWPGVTCPMLKEWSGSFSKTSLYYTWDGLLARLQITEVRTCVPVCPT